MFTKALSTSLLQKQFVIPMIAFIVVIAIWATTPLMLLWSSYAVVPELAAALRMLIGMVVVFMILPIVKLPFDASVQAWKAYSVGAIGVFGGMYCAYLSAQLIPTGLISVCYGFSPLMAGLASHYILKDDKLSVLKVLGLLLAIGGLMVIFLLQDTSDSLSVEGMFLAMLSVLLFCISVVWGKSSQQTLHPLQTLSGSLVIATVCFFIVWYVKGAQLPELNHQQMTQSILAIVYLAIGGSVMGFTAFFYMVKNLSPTITSLPTVITPVFALIVGFYFNHERLSLEIVIGVALIITGLLVFTFSKKRARA